MHLRPSWLLLIALAAPGAFAGEVLQYEDLDTTQLAALDPATTVVLVPGGILEEHGPYLPSGTDTLVSRDITDAVARAIVQRTTRTVLVLPTVYLGPDGANVVGGRHPYPGSLNVHPATMRRVFMDYGDALGEAGFRMVFVLHTHGAPRHNAALDEAGDYFHATWGGRMVSLLGLQAVKDSVRAARAVMSPEAIDAQGFSVHGAAQEHAMVLYLRPDLVDRGYLDAPDWRAGDREHMVELGQASDWPGYWGAPRHSTRAMGEAIVTAMRASAIAAALAIIQGTDPATMPRVSDATRRSPASPRDAAMRARQDAWLEARAR